MVRIVAGMRVAIFGGSGKTGRELIAAALRDGHEVVALARRPGSVPPHDSRVHVVEGDIADEVAVRRVIAGADAVLSALGNGVGRDPTTVYSDGVRAMLRAGTRRIVVVAAIPAGPNADKTWFERWLLHPLLHLFFGAGYDDMRRMEAVLAQSGADWTVLRPPRLTDGPATGRYRSATGRLTRPRSISRADLADAMLTAAVERRWTREAVAISY